MSRFYLHIVLPLMLVAPVAEAQTTARTVSTTSTVTFNFTDIRPEVEASPGWSGQNDPPLSCSDAVKAAAAYLAIHNPLPGAVPESIIIQRMSPTSDKWFYSIDFCTTKRGSATLLVFMNGKVFAPSRTKP